MRKILLVICLILSMTVSAAMPVMVFADDELQDSVSYEPRRVINLVYDDSASMFKNYSTGKLLDTWSKAKYSLEVFVAMLNPDDTMNIYLMSNVDGKAALTLKGSDGVKDNVQKIYDMPAKAANTPFQTVKRAGDDLKKVKVRPGDEKWLVILTDGSLEKQPNVKEDPAVIDKYFDNVADKDIKVMFLAMGKEAKGISANEEKNIFSESSRKTEDILKTMTKSSKRVFNRNSLTVNNDGTFSFDIPMKELVIFAQSKTGKQVSLGSLKSGKKSFVPEVIQIKHADKDRAKKELDSKDSQFHYSKVKADENLSGCLGVIQDDLTEGEYSIEADSADIIDAYYKPAIAVSAVLTSKDGKKIKPGSNVKQGDYTIHYTLVKDGTSEKIKEDSKLLGGNVRYSAEVTNEGETYKTEGQDATVQLNEGKLKIKARADYLDYNYVETELNYEARPDDKVIQFEASDQEFNLDTKGIHGDDIVLTATVDGAVPDADNWASMDIPKVKLTRDDKYIKFKVRKNENKPGEYIAKPYIEGKTLKKLEGKDLRNHQYSVALKHTAISKETWTAKPKDNTFDLNLVEKRNFWDKYWRKIILSGTILLLLLLILSETLWKARFSRSMRRSKNPGVRNIPEDYGQDKTWSTASFNIDFISKIIPFIPEKGILKNVGRGSPPLILKAMRGTSNMRLTNAMAFIKKDNVKFDGQRVTKEEAKSFKINPSTRISVTRKGWKYECIPYQQRGKK